MYTQTFPVCHAPSKPLCSGEMHNAPATEITVIWEKSGHYTQNDHIHRACAHWPSQGMSVPEGGVPWFKPSTPGLACLLMCVSLLSLWDSTSGCYWPSYDRAEKLNASCTLAWFYHSHENGGGAIPSAMAFLLYILITFHFFMIIKEHINFFSGYLWNSKTVCQGGKGVSISWTRKLTLPLGKLIFKRMEHQWHVGREATSCIRCWQMSAWRRIKQSKKDEEGGGQHVSYTYSYILMCRWEGIVTHSSISPGKSRMEEHGGQWFIG